MGHMIATNDTTEAGLLAAIIDNPADDTARLAYTDWLEENAIAVTCDTCGGKGWKESRYRAGLEIGEEYDCVSHAACQKCHGKKVTSDGRAERAEFIRLQCELDIKKRECDLIDADKFYREREYGKIEKRIAELIAMHNPSDWFTISVSDTKRATVCRWRKDAKGFGLFLDKTEAKFFISRGFIHTVRGSLEDLRGKECRTCSGRGKVQLQERGANWSEKCGACRGFGVAGGLLIEIMRTNPVEVVDVTDIVIYPSGGNMAYYLAGLGIFPSHYWSRLESHPSERAVRQALSSVLIAETRERIAAEQQTQTMEQHE